jgi:hypothetical protein
MKTTRTLLAGATAIVAATVTALVMNGTVSASAIDNAPIQNVSTVTNAAEPTAQNEVNYLSSAFTVLEEQFPGRELSTVSASLSPEDLARNSSFTVVDSQGTTYAWDAGTGAFVEDSSATVWPLTEDERPFTPEQISWDALLQQTKTAPALFDDSSLIIGSVRIFAPMGQAVTAADVTFTSAEPELKPSMTFTLDGDLIGVSCPAGKGCNWLATAAQR